MNEGIQNEQELGEVTKDKNRIVTWINAHKKQLTLIGISIPTLIAIVLGLKNKDAIKELGELMREKEDEIAEIRNLMIEKTDKMDKIGRAHV